MTKFSIDVEALVWQDSDVQLGVNLCIKVENGRAFIDEPLDCLLYCVSLILVLQSHGKSHPSDSARTCFGFSLSQDNEVFLFVLHEIMQFMIIG